MQKAFYGTATPCFECTPAQRHQAYKGMRSNAELYLTQSYCLFKNIDGALLLLYTRVQKGQQSFKASNVSFVSFRIEMSPAFAYRVKYDIFNSF